MTDYFSSPFRTFGSSFNINNSNLSGKRRRFYEEGFIFKQEISIIFSLFFFFSFFSFLFFEFVEQNVENQLNEESYQPEKKVRSKTFITPQYNNDERVNEMERALQRLENEVNFLK